MTQERDAGFSFVEVLVSLTLLALIVILLPGTIRLAARASIESAKLIEASQGQNVLGFIRQSIAETMPLLEIDQEGVLSVAFRGDAQSVEYVAPLTYGPAGGGLYRMRIRFLQTDSLVPTDNNAWSSLMLDFAPYRRDSKTFLESRRLIEGVVSGGIRYFGLQTGSQLPQWSSAWTRSDRLPDLIEIDIKLQHPNAAAIGPLRIEPRLRRRD